MSYPHGLEQVDKDGTPFVLHLKKGLYGLRQSANLWYCLLQETLVDLGFIECPPVPSLWRLKDENRGTMLLGIFVDDTTAVFEREEDWTWLTKAIEAKLECTFENQQTSWLLSLKIDSEFSPRSPNHVLRPGSLPSLVPDPSPTAARTGPAASMRVTTTQR